ncbi:phosphotyrosine protein phosphatase, partial [Pseudomonas aeruginosa]
MKGKLLVGLDIADDYAYMQAELLHLLERKAGPFLRRD